MNAFVDLPTASLIEKMSNEEYHSRPEFSSSQLKDMLRSSAHFHSHNIIKEHERETKKHLDFGTLAHTLFLEPEQFHIKTKAIQSLCFTNTPLLQKCAPLV